MFRSLRKVWKSQKGLTLIELLAVVVILGIIAAIAVPAIGNIINNTRDDAKIAEGIQIINGAKIAYASSPESISFTSKELEGFVQNVDAKEKGYSVTVSAEGVFTLIKHKSAALVLNSDNDTSVTEAELIVGRK
ncbi:type II secretion system protein [Bacillus sp. DJP31]|uniref:type II secretion system protein n=1 Tax=Bacillus sp. DJP31 TaxID=3409789 RepID=UPI003BB5506B